MKQRAFTLLEALIAVAIIGVLAMVMVPSYVGYVTKAKIQQTIDLSDPHRTALGNACREGKLGSIKVPTAYDTKYASTIMATSDEAGAVVIITMKQIGSAVNAGDQIIYSGPCTPRGIRWSVTGTVATKYLPSS